MKARLLGLHLGAWVTLAAAFFVVKMGIDHFPLSYELASRSEFVGLAPAAADMLILLCQCVGLLLIFVGALSVWFSLRLGRGDRAARAYFLAVGGLFLARTLVEVMHPVAIPEPTNLVLIIVFVTGLAFAIPAAFSPTVDRQSNSSG